MTKESLPKKSLKTRRLMVLDIRTHFYAFDVVRKKIKDNLSKSRLISISDPFSHLKLNFENKR
jgi:hypothetical protein